MLADWSAVSDLCHTKVKPEVTVLQAQIQLRSADLSRVWFVKGKKKKKDFGGRGMCVLSLPGIKIILAEAKISRPEGGSPTYPISADHTGASGLLTLLNILARWICMSKAPWCSLSLSFSLSVSLYLSLLKCLSVCLVLSLWCEDKCAYTVTWGNTSELWGQKVRWLYYEDFV